MEVFIECPDCNTQVRTKVLVSDAKDLSMMEVIKLDKIPATKLLIREAVSVNDIQNCAHRWGVMSVVKRFEEEREDATFDRNTVIDMVTEMVGQPEKRRRGTMVRQVASGIVEAQNR